MGCASAGADLDLVAALPGAAVDMGEIRRRVSAALPDGASAVREVVGARVPGLRFTVGELGVDLAVVATGDVAPARAVERRAELGEAAAVALSAVSDAAAVRDAVGDRHDAFAALARRSRPGRAPVAWTPPLRRAAGPGVGGAGGAHDARGREPRG